MFPRSNSAIFLRSALIVFSMLLASPVTAAEEQNQFAGVLESGKVLELDDSNFDAAISTFDYIFVDFYAPWCSHCKRLAPELEKAAPMLAKLNQPIVVAKIDADKNKGTASDYGIQGFPTLLIFMHGQPTEYYGSRTADLLVRYLAKFIAPDVAQVSADSVEEFIQAAGKHFPVFIGFGVNASLISRLAAKHKKKAWFAVADNVTSAALAQYELRSAPSILSFYPEYAEESLFYGPWEERALEDFIYESLLPLVLPINEDSLELLKYHKRPIALTIVKDESDAKSKVLLNNLKAAANGHRDFIFAIVGFKQYEEFAEVFEVNKKSQLPKMVVWDGDEKYFTVIGSDSISEVDQPAQITQFLEGYRKGRVIKKDIGLTLKGLISSLFGMRAVYILIFIAAMFTLVLVINKEEPLRARTREPLAQGTISTEFSEVTDPLRNVAKED